MLIASSAARSLNVYNPTEIFSSTFAFALYCRFKSYLYIAGLWVQLQVYTWIDIVKILSIPAPASVVEGDSDAEEGSDTEHVLLDRKSWYRVYAIRRSRDIA